MQKDSGQMMLSRYTLAMCALLGALVLCFIWLILTVMQGHVLTMNGVNKLHLAYTLCLTVATFALFILCTFLPVKRSVASRLSLGSGLVFFAAWHALISGFIVHLSPMVKALGTFVLPLGIGIIAWGLNEFGKTYQLSRLLLGSYRKIEYNLATMDQLTLLFNRRYFFSHCPELLSSGLQNGEQSVLIMLRLENLPEINTTFGHAQGDDMLSEAGKVLSHNTRHNDIAARISGRQLALFLPNTSYSAGEHVVQRILSVSRKLDNPACEQLLLRYSICAANSEESFDELIHRCQNTLVAAPHLRQVL